MKQLLILASILLLVVPQSRSAQLRAGAAKIDITRESARTGDPLYTKALVLSDGTTTSVLLAVDAVAIGGIGSIRDDFLPNVRKRLQQELGIDPAKVLVNASHCHGIVTPQVEDRTVAVVKEAFAKMEKVKVGSGVGFEDSIMENRRLVLKNGRQIDVRQAYSLPPDEEVAAVGPVDTEIGILRVDREDETPLALVYNFACHPIKGIPSGGNTADLSGLASQVIEENLGHGAIALFVQGCGGDINPIEYKQVDLPRDAQPLGNQLAISTLKAARQIKTHQATTLSMVNHVVPLPRADHAKRITELETEQQQLLKALRGTSLNFKTFLPLYTKYKVAGEFPAEYSYRYLRDEQIGRDNLKKLDTRNRKDLERYLKNVYTMESLSRLAINKALLEKHHKRNQEADMKPIEVEVVGLRVGDFRMVTFPGELTVPIGLNLKQQSPHERTFVAGYSNGYIYYAPTAEQLKNVGRAQEDSDCLLAPAWQKIFETKALKILKDL